MRSAYGAPGYADCVEDVRDPTVRPVDELLISRSDRPSLYCLTTNWVNRMVEPGGSQRPRWPRNSGNGSRRGRAGYGMTLIVPCLE